MQESPPNPAQTLSLAGIRWHFGAFVLFETQRRLERAGLAVRIGPRSFDLLLHLIKCAGEFVGKSELLASVWAGVVVEEGSVRVHMSALRKALGEPGGDDECVEWISSVPLRGYRFNGRVRCEAGSVSLMQARPTGESFARPPVRLTELVGRDGDVQQVLGALDAYRLVTIVGTGGIGKTSVAIRVAECRRAGWQGAIGFIDLAPLISPEHVLGTMVRALGAAADLPDAVQAMVERLAGGEALLVIDNCEHVVDALAPPVARLLAALPGLRILATSREALGVNGECVLRLPALAVPADAQQVTLDEAMSWPSVRLLVERAQAAGAQHVAFNEAHAPLLARMARQLDGIPLAIELVAARLGVQSVSDLASRLDDHMRLYSVAGRGALPRHRTLAAALDWSIALLGEDELRLFRRLSVFRGRFDVESALGIDVGINPDETFDALMSLVNKSLVSFDGTQASDPYRLLDTTRSYAAALLGERPDERTAMLRQHAALMLDQMKASTAELPNLGELEWGERHAHRLDDVRFALDVCVDVLVDATTATALVAASAPLWFHVSRVAEYRDRVRAALSLVERQPVPDAACTAALNTALITALLQTRGPSQELDVACDQALAGAIAARSPALELRARWARCTHDMFRGEYQAAAQHAAQLLDLVQPWSDPGAQILAHRASAMAHHFCGRFDVSLRHSEASIPSSSFARMQASFVGPDSIVATQALMCRTLWIQGATQAAMQMARDGLARAESIGHAVSLCSSLYGGSAVALWAGETQQARLWIELMSDEAHRKGLNGWYRYAEWFSQGLRLATARDREACIEEVRASLAASDAPRKEMLLTFCLDWLDDELVERVARGESLWCAAEVWRALGWRHERAGAHDEAARSYRRALDLATQQGALAWQARAEQSLARIEIA